MASVAADPRVERAQAGGRAEAGGPRRDLMGHRRDDAAAEHAARVLTPHSHLRVRPDRRVREMRRPGLLLATRHGAGDMLSGTVGCRHRANRVQTRGGGRRRKTRRI